jgi:hypothetical protein
VCTERRGGAIGFWIFLSPTWSLSCADSFEKPGSAIVGIADLAADHDLLPIGGSSKLAF